MKKHLVWALALVFGLWNLGRFHPIQAQATFQNNDTSCEEHQVIAEDQFLPDESVIFLLDSAVTCGRFNDDSAVMDPTHGGNPDFPDCATQVDAIVTTPEPQLTNSILTNTAAHGDNCVNAGGANPQFQPPDFLGLEDLDNMRMGSIVHGNLNGGGFDDLAMVAAGETFDMSSRAVGFLLTQPGGGFGNPTMASGVALLEPMAPIPYQTFPISLAMNQINQALMAQSSLVLQDCDGDGVDEALVTVKEATDSQMIGLMVVQNDGTGLVDNPAPVFVPLPATPEPVAASGDDLSIPLVQGDFSGDGIPDVVAAIADMDQPDGAVALCVGNGACGFDCPATDEPNVVQIPNAGWFSATSGDFDGDDRPDVVVAELSNFGMGTPLGQLRYLLNNGGNLEDWQQVVLPLNPPGFDLGAAFALAPGRFTTGAVQNQVDEVVGTTGNVSSMGPSTINVTLVPTDGMGGFDAPRLLNFADPPPGLAPLAGLDAADFDRCGGDDILSLAQALDPVAVQANVFLNINEAPVVTIGAGVPTELLINTPLNIPTTCSDPTFDERNFQWMVVSQPAGSNVTLGTPNGTVTGLDDDVSTTFEADQVGNYTIQIDCTDFCGLSDEDLHQIQVISNVTLPLTQGSNLFNCHLGSAVAVSGGAQAWGLTILLAVPALIGVFRRARQRSNS
jgi:hypothetical protein